MALWTVVGLLAEFILLCLTWSTIGNLVRYSPQSAVLKQFYGASNTSTYALFQTQEALCAVWFVLLLSFLGPLLWKEIALLRAEWKDQTSRKRMQKTTSSRKRKVSAKTVPEEEGLLTQITYQSKMKSNDSIFWPLIFLLCTWLKIVMVSLVSGFFILHGVALDKILQPAMFESSGSDVKILEQSVDMVYLGFTYGVITILVMWIEQNGAFYQIGRIHGSSQ